MTPEGMFWMVWNPDGRPPTFKHTSEAAAKAEAERLARTVSGAKFYVLRAVSITEPVDIQTRELVDLDNIAF